MQKVTSCIYYLTTRPLWFWLWGLIYAMMLVFGLFWPQAISLTVLKLSSIFLCFLFVLHYFNKDRLLLFAFLFTFVADVILAINNLAAIGVLIFAIAQITHFVRLCENPKLIKVWLIVICLLLVIISILPLTNSIIFYGIVYGVTLAANFFICFSQYRKEHNRSTLYSLLGFGLFICCDILVAVSFFSTIGIFPAFLVGIANYCCWLFYLPSQVCLANSSKSVVQ